MYPQKRLTIADVSTPPLPDHPVMAHIDAHAAAVLAETARAVKAILDRRAQMDRDGRAHETLFVNMGERHDVPAHLVTGMAVVENVRRVVPEIVGALEYPHDLTARSIATQENIDIRSTAFRTMADNITEADTYGQIALPAMSALSSRAGAHYTGYALHDYLARAFIPTIFNDVSRDGYSINRHDPSSAASIKACEGDHRDIAYWWEKMSGMNVPIGMRTATGVHVRNHHMAAALGRFAEETGARIAFQRCGAAHVVGQHQNYKPAYSLSGCLKADNRQVQNIIMADNPPIKATAERVMRDDPALAGAMIMNGMLPRLATAYKDSQKSCPAGDKDYISCVEHESAYADELLRRVGMGDHVIEEDSIEALHKRCINRARAVLVLMNNPAHGR